MRRLPDLARSPLFALFRGSDTPFARRIRQRMYGTACHIDTDVFITNPANFNAGDGCALYHATYVLNTHGRLVLGSSSHLGAFCYVNAHHGVITIGEGVAIGPGTRLIAYSNHYGEGRRIADERISADITIGSNVFIGAGCTILPGTTIGDNVVIAAGAVVKGALGEEGIYGGLPARRIGEPWY